MVKMFKVVDSNKDNVLEFCPYKRTIKECDEVESCAYYAEHCGCVPYDLQFLWG